MDVEKMIVSQIISAVRVSKDYTIEVAFKISEKQLGLENEYETSAEKTPKKKTPKRSGAITQSFGEVTQAVEIMEDGSVSFPTRDSLKR